MKFLLPSFTWEKCQPSLHHRGNGIRFGEDLQNFFEKNCSH